jgi:hypothetical protein
MTGPDDFVKYIFANGMDWAPGTRILWTVVNERDELGDDLVPDYLTSVREGAFYGWPYSYFGQNKDPRKKGERPDLVAKAVIPDLAIGAHTASLGLTFYDASAFPDRSGSRSCRTARCSSRTTAETSSGGLRILIRHDGVALDMTFRGGRLTRGATA